MNHTLCITRKSTTKVDPETYRVRVDGEDIRSEPARSLPLAQRYSLF